MKPIFKLGLGIVVVLLFVAGLVVYQDHIQGHIADTQANISATPYSVGVEYAGVIVSQKVQKGQVVTKGEVLGTLKSGTLMEHLRLGELQVQDLPYPINSNSEIELKAANDGIVKDINYSEGSFVPANQPIYTIIDTSQYYVISVFELDDQQLKELDQTKDIELTLQSGLSLPTKIRDISIKPNGTKQEVTVESVPVSALNQQSFKLGEPVKTTLVLRDQDLLSSIANWSTQQWMSVQRIFKK